MGKNILKIAPSINPITNNGGMNCRKVAGLPNFLFTNGLYSPY